MNIEKIKNYNQRMLALLCTLGVLLGVVAIVAAVIEIWPHNYGYDDPQGLISPEGVDELNQNNLRKQIISYESPYLADTLHSIYVVPVVIKTLKKAEQSPYVQEDLMLCCAEFPALSKLGKGYYSRSYIGSQYVNLVIYDAVADKAIALFDKRIMIGEVEVYYFRNDEILLIFRTATQDADHNGVIDMSDARTLHIYSLHSGEMRELSDPEGCLTAYQFIENSQDLLVSFKQDAYKDKQFDQYSAPIKIMRYDFQTRALHNIIPQAVQDDMQKLVEAK